MTDAQPDTPGFDWRSDRLGAARAGANPLVLRRLPTGWAILGDHQRLAGYCVLLHDGDADQLTDLAPAQRTRFLDDMVLLGQAVARACSRLDPGFRRINYEILGNTYPHLHAHVRARYSWEPEPLRRGPVWRYDDLMDSRYAVGPQHDGLRTELLRALDELAGTP